MNWLSNNWIWLLGFGFLAMMFLSRRGDHSMGCSHWRQGSPDATQETASHAGQ
jgi:hypothetical protein